jgi:ankyrin repeat protein
MENWRRFETHHIPFGKYALGTALLRRCDHHEPPNINTVKRCLKHGAYLDLIDDYGRTALHLAASWGHIAVVLHLLAAGADPSRKSKWGNTFLHDLVPTKNAVHILAYIVRTYKLDLEIKNEAGRTVVYEAIRYERDIVPLLFSLGARFHHDYCCFCYDAHEDMGECYGYTIHHRWVILLWRRKKLPSDLIRYLLCTQL